MVTNIGDYRVLKMATTTTTSSADGFYASGYIQPMGLRIDDGEFHAAHFSPETISALKNALGYGDVIVKCGYCGQYGAIKTACRHCGQAIDPR